LTGLGRPAGSDRGGIRHLELLRVPLMIKLQGVVACVRRIADGLANGNDPIAEIHRAEHCGEHADIGFRSGDNRPIRLAGLQ
jgi:hypothetical protein